MIRQTSTLFIETKCSKGGPDFSASVVKCVGYILGNSGHETIRVHFYSMVLITEYPHTVNLFNWRQVVPRSPSASSYPFPDPSTIWPRPCGLGPKPRKMAALRLKEFAVQTSLNFPPRKDVAQGKKKWTLWLRRHNCLATRQSIGHLILIDRTFLFEVRMSAKWRRKADLDAKEWYNPLSATAVAWISWSVSWSNPGVVIMRPRYVWGQCRAFACYFKMPASTMKMPASTIKGLHQL